MIYSPLQLQLYCSSIKKYTVSQDETTTFYHCTIKEHH